MNRKYSREYIIETGIGLFRTSGYHKTGIQEILKACDIPKGSFYNYFSSKEAYAIACIRQYSREVLEYWQAIEHSDELNGEQKVNAAFKVLFDEYNEADFSRSCLLGNLSLEMGSLNEEIASLIEESWNEWKESLRHMIQDAREEGSFSSKWSSAAITNFLFDVYYGILNRIKIEQNALPIKQFFTVYMPLMQQKD